MTHSMGSVPVALGLSVVAAGFVGLVVPVTGGLVTVSIAFVVVSLLAALFGAACGTFASTRRGAVAVGALTGFLIAGWAWVMGLSTLVAVWSSADLFAQEAQGALTNTADQSLRQLGSTIYFSLAVGWISFASAATVIGGICGWLVGPMADETRRRLLPATTPVFLGGLLWIGAVATTGGVNELLQEFPLSARFLPVAFGFLAPAVMLAWAALGIGQRLRHSVRRVRVIGWVSVVTLVVVAALSGLAGSILMLIWTIPVAVGVPCAGLFLGALASMFVASGDEALPTWSDAVSEGVLAASVATILLVGPIGLSTTLSIAYLVIPAFNEMTGFDGAAVPELSERISGLRAFLLWSLVATLIAALTQVVVGLIGVGIHRWAVRGDIPQLPPATSVSASSQPMLGIRDGVDAGPFQAPTEL